MAAHSTRTPAISRGKTMNRRLYKSMLGVACALAPAVLAANAAPAMAQTVMRPAGDVVLSIGRGQLVTVPGNMADVFVANESVADVQIKSTRQLYLFGKAGGETTVYASNAAGDVVWSANVRVGSNLESVDQMLRVAMPDAQIAVSSMSSNTFLLTGTVKAPEDAAEAERLVQAFAGKDANVISRLRTATPLQVNLRVKFAEVSRTLARDLNSNLTTIDGTGGFKFGIGQARGGFADFFRPGGPAGVGNNPRTLVINPATLGTPFPTYIEVPSTAVNTNTIGTTLGLAGKVLGVDILGALDLGEQAGLVTTLSEPNLTALSGETADFLAGGEFPIPISQGLGTTTIEYKKFGVSLAYTPTVLANGRISIRVRPEVSELSSEGAITINGFQVPALTVRRAETTVELGSGQSFMIAGLMRNSSQNTLRKMPGAGDMPIIGALFRSTAFRKGETELVIVVTPYLVNPVDSNDIKLPTDGLRTPNIIQQMFGNIEQDGRSGVGRPLPKAAPDRTVAPGTSAAPSVGAAESAAAPALASSERKQRKQRSRGGSDLPAPGFNLK
jgi:pilus assembly protein CpaC